MPAYDNVESGPAEIVGPKRGKKLLRLRFIPFVYATPTYDDVVLATKDPELNGHWTFECPGPYGMDVADLYDHGEHYAMIVDFEPGGDHRGPWFPGRTAIISAVAWDASEDKAGRIYFAPPESVPPPEVMRALAVGHPEFQFTLVHPASGGER